MPDKPAPNGWTEWKQYVLKAIERVDEDIKAMRTDLAEMRVAITTIQAKAAIFGATGGALGILAVEVALRVVFKGVL